VLTFIKKHHHEVVVLDQLLGFEDRLIIVEAIKALHSHSELNINRIR
jgi:hypothetical protein